MTSSYLAMCSKSGGRVTTSSPWLIHTVSFFSLKSRLVRKLIRDVLLVLVTYSEVENIATVAYELELHLAVLFHLAWLHLAADVMSKPLGEKKMKMMSHIEI